MLILFLAWLFYIPLAVALFFFLFAFLVIYSTSGNGISGAFASAVLILGTLIPFALMVIFTHITLKNIKKQSKESELGSKNSETHK